MNSSNFNEIRLQVGVESLVGRLRESNEDSYAVFAPAVDAAEHAGIDGLLLVADGMGGELAGDVASQLAADAIRTWADELQRASFQSRSPGAVDNATGTLELAFERANRDIYRYGKDNRAAEGLGTTLVVATLIGNELVVAHIGDSRCYRVRDGQVEQLTADHSWVEQQVQAGLLSRDGMESHPQSNVLTRSLGTENSELPDVLVEGAQENDLLILCSDGMTGAVREADILEASSLSEPQAIAQRLAQLANDRDGSDNITVAVGRLRGANEHGQVPTVAAPSRATGARVRAFAAVAALAIFAIAYAAGAYLGIPGTEVEAAETIETRASLLLEQASRDLEAGDSEGAVSRLRQARELFQLAPQAREAQRRLTALERRPAAEPVNSSASPAATEIPAQSPATNDTEAAAAQEDLGDETAEATTEATAEAIAEPEAQISDAARAEAKAAENSGSD